MPVKNLLFLALLLTGCAPTLTEIRDLKPTHSGAIAGDYRHVARCTLDRLDLRSWWQTWGAPPTRNQLTERDGYAEIVGWTSGGAPVFAIMFAPAHAEVRYNTSGVQNDTLWPLVEACGRRA